MAAGAAWASQAAGSRSSRATAEHRGGRASRYDREHRTTKHRGLPGAFAATSRG